MLCREHGQQLTSVATTTTKDTTEPEGFEGFELFGIVKETGVVRTVPYYRMYAIFQFLSSFDARNFFSLLIRFEFCLPLFLITLMYGNEIVYRNSSVFIFSSLFATPIILIG